MKSATIKSLQTSHFLTYLSQISCFTTFPQQIVMTELFSRNAFSTSNHWLIDSGKERPCFRVTPWAEMNWHLTIVLFRLEQTQLHPSLHPLPTVLLLNFSKVPSRKFLKVTTCVLSDVNSICLPLIHSNVSTKSRLPLSLTQNWYYFHTTRKLRKPKLLKAETGHGSLFQKINWIE